MQICNQTLCLLMLVREAQEQSKTGSDQLFAGRMASSWINLQDKHLSRSCPPRSNLSDSRWAVSVIDIIWTWFRDCWDERNTTLHGVNGEFFKERLREKTIRELNSICCLRDQVRHRDKDMFQDSIATHIENSSSTAMRNWITVWKLAILGSMQQVKDHAIQNV